MFNLVFGGMFPLYWIPVHSITVLIVEYSWIEQHARNAGYVASFIPTMFTPTSSGPAQRFHHNRTFVTVFLIRVEMNHPSPRRRTHAGLEEKRDDIEGDRVLRLKNSTRVKPGKEFVSLSLKLRRP